MNKKEIEIEKIERVLDIWNKRYDAIGDQIVMYRKHNLKIEEMVMIRCQNILEQCQRDLRNINEEHEGLQPEIKPDIRI